MQARGEDPMENFARSLKAEAAVIAGFPGMTFGIHLCRGNQRSMWHREGSYDAIAEKLFNTLKHQRILLEYDSDRAGGFEPLKRLQKDRIAVLGLVTTKTGQLEGKDAIKRRLDEAAKFTSLDRLSLSPQCGFASTEEGNTLAEDEEWAKLKMIVEVAQEVWGK